MKITESWLLSIGFTQKGINGWSILLPPIAVGAAITELYIDFDGVVHLAQGCPDDLEAADDIVVLTSVVFRSQEKLLLLLDVLGLRK